MNLYYSSRKLLKAKLHHKSQRSTNCRLLAIGQCAGKSAVQIYVTKKLEVYLVNPTSQDISFPACELFGFNTGAFELKVSGSRGQLLFRASNFFQVQ